MGAVAYNPSDPTQASFLSALALGESGGSNNPFLGTGGTDLSHAPVDATGFPQWSGITTSAGPSHAAGIFQFQPGTWAAFASKYGLHFDNPQDQAAAAWYDAQAVFTRNTGGDLESALKAGNYSQVQSALATEWTSVTGNAAAPQGLAHDLAAGIGAAIPGGPVSTSATGVSSGGIVGNIQDWLIRGGVLIIGTIIVLVALWMLLSQQGYVPSPKQVGGAVAKAVAA